MTHDHSTVAFFNTHASAEAAIRSLSEAGFPIERLSIIGKVYQMEEQVVGFFNLSDGWRVEIHTSQAAGAANTHADGNATPVATHGA